MRLLGIAAVLVAALAVVATLQYRWIGDVAEAEEQRARALRDVAAHHFAGDVDREAAQIAGAFQAAHEEELPARLHEWTSLAHDPRLVEAIYVADPNRIRRFDGEKLVDATWPDSLKPVHDIIGTIPQHRRSPFVEAVPAIVMPLRPQPPWPPRFDGPPPPPMFGGPPPFAFDPSSPAPLPADAGRGEPLLLGRRESPRPAQRGEGGPFGFAQGKLRPGEGFRRRARRKS
jgi:hypothetical protein